MNNQSTQRQLIQGDEIDLRVLWMALVKRKVVIVLVTLLTTVCAIFYVNVVSTAPVYNGDVLIEIGDIIINSEATNDKPTIVQLIEDQNTLKEVLTEFLSYESDGSQITIEIPKGSNSLFRLSCKNTDKKIIQSKLEQAIHLIFERHRKKADFYHKATNATINPTAIVSKINITTGPINTNKERIIGMAFISGLILGIFFVFFIEFIKSKQDSENTEQSE